MKVLIYCLKQFLPLMYQEVYTSDGRRKMRIWNQWFFHKFNERTINYPYTPEEREKQKDTALYIARYSTDVVRSLMEYGFDKASDLDYVLTFAKHVVTKWRNEMDT